MKGYRMFSRALGAAAMGALLSAVLALPGHAEEDRHVKVINETSSYLMEFYASTVNATTWEEDILGTDVLAPGQDVTINIDDGSGRCLYDFKAVFDDGEELIRNSIDVCEVGVYRYHE